MDVHVIDVTWADRSHDLTQIRRTVFIEEQRVPPQIEMDGADPECDHFLALNSAGIALGCGRLAPSGQIGRMAVLPEHRGRRIGRRILDAAIERAIERGLADVHLHAQVEAVGFYEKAGFLPTGNRFHEAGIEHQAMRLALPVGFEPTTIETGPRIVPESPDKKRDLSRLVVMSGESACSARLRELAESARRYLRIFSPSLDHALFDQQSLADLMSAFARANRRAEVQILVIDTRPIVQRGHLLLDLARRLPSKVNMRAVPDTTADELRSWMTADEDGFWLLPDSDEHEGVSNLWDPVTTRRLNERFEYLWQRSIEDRELRLLSL